MSETGAARHRLHWLPNALTVSRILLIPVLVWGIILTLYTPRWGWGGKDVGFDHMPYVLGLFILCALTDFLDGYFARKWGVTSDFGRMLDPIADKLLVSGCLIAICFALFGGIAWLLPATLIILFRDISISGLREHAALENIVMAPTKLAKWKTAFEMLAIFLFLTAMTLSNDFSFDKVQNATFEYGVFIAATATLWLAAILSAYTGFHYFRSAMRK